MTIAELRDKCKGLIGRIPQDILVVTVIILASLLSFGLGYLAGLDAGKTAEFTFSEAVPEKVAAATAPEVGKVVASKNGTKYYLPTCAGARRISEANKVWFASVAAAQQAGYAPAENCPGI